ncbi:MAG: type VI secretion system lipoprotein TssJ [Deltaproteobacteria bacterium]|nr:type VI secretion system lipoprotein TssJ [Deltaproteobacteria bacterium]
MKTWLKLVLVLVVVVFIFSCGSKKGSTQKSTSEIEPDEWNYQRDAIRLVLTADPQLNAHDGLPHTLHLCLYQLKDPNAFNQFSGDEDGLYLLLGCSVFDQSVTSFQRLTIQPGQQLTQSFDRAEGSRYVGIAAGYYIIEKERITRFLKIPVKIKRRGLLFKKYGVPGELDLEITLGSQQIEKVETIQ